MSSARPAVAVFVVALLAPTLPSADAPAGFHPDLAAAQIEAKTTGVPVFVLVAEEPPAVLASPRAAIRMKRFHSAMIAPGSAAAKKLGADAAPAAVILDSKGTVAARLPKGFTLGQLISVADPVVASARAALVTRVKGDGPADRRKAAVASLTRLATPPAELVPLLTVQPAEVREAVEAAIKAAPPVAASVALIDAVAGPSPQLRTAAYPLAVSISGSPDVPPVKFWQEANAKQRAVARDKWRESVLAVMNPLNEAVIGFCEQCLGKQVGNGECVMLPAEAYEETGGRRMRNVGKTYDWGRKLAAGETVFPGDVIQMEDCKFAGGGSAPHHTVVVRKVLAPGRYELLEQNVNGRRTVAPGLLDMEKLTAGTVTVYRPEPSGRKN